MLLGGSRDLVSEVISTFIGDISTVTLLTTLVTKSHDPLHDPPHSYRTLNSNPYRPLKGTLITTSHDPLNHPLNPYGTLNSNPYRALKVQLLHIPGLIFIEQGFEAHHRV